MYRTKKGEGDTKEDTFQASAAGMSGKISIPNKLISIRSLVPSDAVTH